VSAPSVEAEVVDEVGVAVEVGVGVGVEVAAKPTPDNAISGIATDADPSGVGGSRRSHARTPCTETNTNQPALIARAA
jgi:hypothetical protein